MENAHPVTIRKAVTEDIPAIMELASFAKDAAAWASGKYEVRISGSSGVVLVAESGSRIAAFIVMHVVVAGECEIENVAVASEQRRQGLGGRLVSAVLDSARNNRCTAVWLEVRASNFAAQQLYKSLGFQEVGRRRTYYRDPQEDALVLKLTI